MKKRNIIKKVLAKLSRPTLGSFYILGETVYFSTIRAGLDHKELWKIIVHKVFKDLSSSDRAALLKANYGSDRGRVTWSGEIIDFMPIGVGQYIIEGTPGCEKYEKEIKDTFGLGGKKIKTDWESSLVYITVKEEKNVVQRILKENPPPTGFTHVAKINLDKEF